MIGERFRAVQDAVGRPSTPQSPALENQANASLACYNSHMHCVTLWQKHPICEMDMDGIGASEASSRHLAWSRRRLPATRLATTCIIFTASLHLGSVKLGTAVCLAHLCHIEQLGHGAFGHAPLEPEPPLQRIFDEVPAWLPHGGDDELLALRLALDLEYASGVGVILILLLSDGLPGATTFHRVSESAHIGA